MALTCCRYSMRGRASTSCRETNHDIGCGTGHLTAQIAAAGAEVIGLDRSAEMIEQARRNFPHLRFHQGEANAFTFPESFDAVFSNAVLHWVPDAEGVVRSVARALKPRGRFVAEFGGKGNVRHVLEAAAAAAARRGYRAPNPWYFPSVADYTTLLEACGFEIRFASLFDRLTPQEDPELGMVQWLRMFGQDLLREAPAAEHDALLGEISERLRPVLFRGGKWFVDYKRLRVAALLL